MKVEEKESVKQAKRLTRMFKDIVMYDHRYDEKPIFGYQQLAARRVCDELIKQCGTFELSAQRMLWKQVKTEILKLKK